MIRIALALLLLTSCAKTQLGGACKINDECAEGLLCNASQTCQRLQCTTNQNCPNNFECVGLVCVEKGKAPGGGTGSTGNTTGPNGSEVVVTVQSSLFRPLSGVIAIAGSGQGVATDAQGRATIASVTAPYDLTVLLPLQTLPVGNQVRQPTIYKIMGLTRRDPMILVFENTKPSHDVLTGSLMGSLPAGGDRFVLYDGGADATGSVSTNASNFTLDVYRKTTAPPQGTVYALAVSTGAAANKGYTFGQQALPLSSSLSTQSVNLTLSSVGNVHTINGTITLPQNGNPWSILSILVAGRFGSAMSFLFDVQPAASPFALQLPVIAGLQKQVQIIATETNSTAERTLNQRLGDAAASLNVTFMDNVTLSDPAHGDLTIAPGTDFKWQAPGVLASGIHALDVKLGKALVFRCVTRGLECELPNTQGYGSSWTMPVGATGTWTVHTTAPTAGGAAASIDDITSATPNDTLSQTTFFTAMPDAQSATAASRNFTTK